MTTRTVKNPDEETVQRWSPEPELATGPVEVNEEGFPTKVPQIERGLPIPSRSGGHGGASTIRAKWMLYPFTAMVVGESFGVPVPKDASAKERAAIGQRIYTATSQFKNTVAGKGKDFTTRVSNDKLEYRCWRTK